MTFTVYIFSPEAMVKFTRRATGHFVTLIESGMHLITCISGHRKFGVSKELIRVIFPP